MGISRPVTSPLLPTRRQAYAACLVAAATFVACAGLLGAAVLAPAPAAVVPLVAVVCVGCPMALGWSLPASIAVLRATSPRSGDADAAPALDERALGALRRQLDRLPETEHPLGL